MKVITRELYARKVDAWLGREQIIVLVGQRRVGKSYVMKGILTMVDSLVLSTSHWIMRIW